MASAFSSPGGEVFNRIRKQIEDEFDSIVDKLIRRRAILLQELIDLEREVFVARRSCMQTIENLKRERKQLEELLATVKMNQPIDALEKGIEEIDKEIRMNEGKLKNSWQVTLDCDKQSLELNIAKYGTLVIGNGPQTGNAGQQKQQGNNSSKQKQKQKKQDGDDGQQKQNGNGGQQTPEGNAGQQKQQGNNNNRKQRRKQKQKQDGDAGQQTPGGQGGQQPPGGQGGQQTPGGKGRQQTPGGQGGQQPPGGKGRQQTPGGQGGQQTPGGKGRQQTPGGQGGQQPPGAKGGQQPPGGQGGQQPPGAKGGQQKQGKKAGKEKQGNNPAGAGNHSSGFTPVKSFGKLGNCELTAFECPRGVLVDDTYDRIYVADSSRHRIQVWNMTGVKLIEFGTQILKDPWEISLWNDHIFISDFTGNSISKWNSKILKFVKKSIDLSKPAGLDIDDGEVFVVEYGNNRISVLDADLVLKRIIANKMIAKSHGLRVRNNIVHVIEDSGVIKTFSKTGQLLKTIANKASIPRRVFHFNMDSQLNFLVTNFENNSLETLSPQGDVIRSISFTGSAQREPFGVDVSRDGRIVVSFQFGNYAVAIF